VRGRMRAPDGKMCAHAAASDGGGVAAHAAAAAAAASAPGALFPLSTDAPACSLHSRASDACLPDASLPPRRRCAWRGTPAARTTR
jgi:hypothetical protein